MSRAKALCELLDDTEDEVVETPSSFPTLSDDQFPFDLTTAMTALSKRLTMLRIDGIQVDDMEADEDGNIVVTFTDYEDNSLDVVFNYGPEGACAIIVGDGGDVEDEDNIVIDLDTLGVPLVDTKVGPYINLMELSWLSKATLETILTAGALLDKTVNIQQRSLTRDAVGNIIIAQSEGYEYDLESITLDESINEVLENGEIVEVAYKTVVRGGKKVRRPLVRRMRKKRLTPKQRAGIKKASRTKKGSKSKAKRKRSSMLRRRLHLHPVKARKGMRVG
jgi:hypothetical protein